MLCFEFFISQFCRYAQKLSRRTKTFRLAMPTRRRGFSDSAWPPEPSTPDAGADTSGADDRSDAGGMHFVYGASPQHILLHFPIKLLHLPIKFASFPQQTASFPQQFASFPQQIASFPQHSFSLPQHILCHFAKHRIKVFFCDLFSFLPLLAVPRQLYWWSEWWRDLTWPKKDNDKDKHKHNHNDKDKHI